MKTTTQNKDGQTVSALIKVTDAKNHDSTTVRFTDCGSHIRVYTYGIYTDYTTSFDMTREEARQAWKDLLSKGFERAVFVAYAGAEITVTKAEAA